MIKISVIIPTFNEAVGIMPILAQMKKYGHETDIEIIISDSPQSRDNLSEIARSFNVAYIKSTVAGRAFQMNFGAKVARGEILYFVHADTLVHPDYVQDILHATQSGTDLGCYRYRFDKYPNCLLHVNVFFNQFSPIWCRGGDQTLFIKKSVFEDLGGFDEKLLIMEDYDILQRAEGNYKFKIIPKSIVVSARKYEKNSYFQVQRANLKIMKRWLNGDRNTAEMARIYRESLNF